MQTMTVSIGSYIVFESSHNRDTKHMENCNMQNMGRKKKTFL